MKSSHKTQKCYLIYSNVHNHCVSGLESYPETVQQLCRGRSGEASLYTAQKMYANLQIWLKEYLKTIAVVRG